MNKYSSSVSIIQFLGLFAALSIAGCAGADAELRSEPNYGLGYNDGCNTANRRISGSQSTIRRNEHLYESDRAYSAGWKDGYNFCGDTTNRDRNILGRGDRWFDW